MILGSDILLRPDELTHDEWVTLFKRLTFLDAEGLEIRAYDSSARGIRVPRGVLSWLPDRLEVTDRRVRPRLPKLRFALTLDSEGFTGQQEALQTMFKQTQGVIVRQPGAGKTQIALAFVAASKTRVLVIVHTRDLAKQWEDYAKRALPGIDLGRIGGGQMHVGQLTVATVQTLKRFTAVEKLWQQFGAVIVDETHHAAAESWEWVLNVCPAYYRFGFTATVKRADARHPLVNMLVGPVIHNAKFESKVPITMYPVDTHFRGVYRGPSDWQYLLRQIARDKPRNELIAKIAVDEMNRGNTTLVLSRQIKHLQNVRDEIVNLAGIKGVVLLTGSISDKDRKLAIEGMRDGKVKILLATQLADEGLDVPRLNRLLLTWPGKHDGRIIQQIGRIIRQHPDKSDAVIYDFVDRVPVLERQFRDRLFTYRNLGIKKGKVIDYAKKEKGRKLSLSDFRVRRSAGP